MAESHKPPTSTTKVANPNFSQSDVDFLSHMIPHHSDAIKMSKESMSDFKNPKVIELAKNIIKMQKEEIEYMNGLLKEAGTDPVTDQTTQHSRC